MCVNAFFNCSGEKVVVDFLNGKAFLQSILARTKASAKTALSKSLPTTAEGLLFFYGIANVEEYMGDERLHAQVQWQAGCRITVAVQGVIRAWSTLSSSIELGTFQTAYSLYSLYERKIAMSHVFKPTKYVL